MHLEIVLPSCYRFATYEDTYLLNCLFLLILGIKSFIKISILFAGNKTGQLTIALHLHDTVLLPATNIEILMNQKSTRSLVKVLFGFWFQDF